MTDQPTVWNGAAEDTGDALPARNEADVRDAEEAHGGSMAPGLVDETGHPIAEPPAETRST